MASVGLGILGTLGAAATTTAKTAAAATGLRRRSVKNVITGERIPGSSSNRFFQLLGKENKEDAENTIKAAEKASAGKKGLVFVLELLLKTLFDQQVLLTYLPAGMYPNSEWERQLVVEEMQELKERENRLLYIIVYSSFLKEPNATQDMHNLRKKIKTDFGLNRPDHEVTNWKNLYVQQPYLPDFDFYTFWNLRYRIHEQLSKKIDHVREYIEIEKEIKKNAYLTRDRSWMRRVVREKAKKRNLDPTVSPEGIGPFNNLGAFLPDTEEKQRLQDEAEKNATEEEEYHGRSVNAGGRRSRKRKTRKKRKRTRKKRKSRRKKQRKSRRKYK